MGLYRMIHSSGQNCCSTRSPWMRAPPDLLLLCRLPSLHYNFGPGPSPQGILHGLQPQATSSFSTMVPTIGCMCRCALRCSWTAGNFWSDAWSTTTSLNLFTDLSVSGDKFSLHFLTALSQLLLCSIFSHCLRYVLRYDQHCSWLSSGQCQVPFGDGWNWL